MPCSNITIVMWKGMRFTSNNCDDDDHCCRSFLPLQIGIHVECLIEFRNEGEKNKCVHNKLLQFLRVCIQSNTNNTNKCIFQEKIKMAYIISRTELTHIKWNNVAHFGIQQQQQCIQHFFFYTSIPIVDFSMSRHFCSQPHTRIPIASSTCIRLLSFCCCCWSNRRVGSHATSFWVHWNRKFSWHQHDYFGAVTSIPTDNPKESINKIYFRFASGPIYVKFRLESEKNLKMV